MLQIKVATWNVNSIRMRLETVLDWLEKHQPQVLCIQETKTPDVQFPKESFYKLGYEVSFTGQKSYNGMAIISALPSTDVCFDFTENPEALQKRFISATLGGIRLINFESKGMREATISTDSSEKLTERRPIPHFATPVPEKE